MTAPEEPNATILNEEGKVQPVVVQLDPPLPEQIADIHEEMVKKGGPGLMPGKAVDNPVSKPATTTAEQDRSSEGQRRLYSTWEYTQSFIALLTVVSTIAYMFLTLYVKPVDSTAALFFSSAFTLVIGFYFGKSSRSNERPADSQRNTTIETVWDFRDEVKNK